MARVKVSELEKLYEKYNEKTITTLSLGNEEDRFTFEVKYRLTEKEVADIVDMVCDETVDIRNRIYRPEMKDYFLRIAVLKTYTNLTMPKGANGWKLAYGTPVFAMVTGHERRPVIFDGYYYDDNMVIDVEQYEQMLCAIEAKIAYRLRKMV